HDHHANPAAEDLFGQPQAQLAGQSLALLLPGIDMPATGDGEGEGEGEGEAPEPSAQGFGTRSTAGTALDPDGTAFPVGATIRRHHDGSGDFLTIICQDAREIARSRARLQQLQGELAQLAKLTQLGELASTLAHELNQPLSTISNYAQGAVKIVRQAPDTISERLHEALSEIAAQSLRAGKIIRHLRDFVLHGQTAQAPEDMRGLVEQAGAIALGGAGAQGIGVTFTFPAGSAIVMVNGVQIQQVLTNLMRNAMEAMRNSPVRELTVRAQKDGAWVVVEVADTGPGFAPAMEPYLFKPFVTSKHGGMGMGLSICRRIVEAQGGTLTASLNDHGGATFRFTLPAHHAEHSAVDA
ncbi:MAG: GHKL domain-containing protein, partial [Phyllobacteriaceae bacterium]|nr:GHKL domain-containing protein [Phyllobacteriaceae bacterium]